MSLLATPLVLGNLTLKNRLVMAPMTRLRADGGLAPRPIVATYYGQRASAGLIVTESIAVAPYGDGYPGIPGIFTPAQQAGWRVVTEEVHRRGGLIAAQLWHVGRARTAPPDAPPRPPGWAVTEGLLPADLDAADIDGMLAGFAAGARAAREAGFDAVEIHSGNGFLLDRFLRPATNRRTDAFGGSAIGRTRLLLAILDAVAAAGLPFGARLSPSATVDGAPDPDAHEIFADVLGRLDGLAYVHLTRATAEDRAHGAGPGVALRDLRAAYRGPIVGAGGFDGPDAERALREGEVDAIAFARLFLANPDLPARLAAGAPLNAAVPATFYTNDAAGYTDYPALDT